MRFGAIGDRLLAGWLPFTLGRRGLTVGGKIWGVSRWRISANCVLARTGGCLRGNCEFLYRTRAIWWILLGKIHVIINDYIPVWTVFIPLSFLFFLLFPFSFLFFLSFSFPLSSFSLFLPFFILSHNFASTSFQVLKAWNNVYKAVLYFQIQNWVFLLTTPHDKRRLFCIRQLHPGLSGVNLLVRLLC